VIALTGLRAGAFRVLAPQEEWLLRSLLDRLAPSQPLEKGHRLPPSVIRGLYPTNAEV